ncbi:hypothetical protein ACFVU4_00680 [Streptomyces sp. NPDC058107]|uniref:hypothetical protein n=1 Tax=Streptomyces sp. NPDC058107 TaxID=3346343 RepID=UPI0036ECFAFE
MGRSHHCWFVFTPVADRLADPRRHPVRVRRPHQADGELAATGANGTIPMTIGAGVVLVTRPRKAGARA